ncbi:MAG TPA: MBL fold metallo-hydrolase [Treponemataceae bacterium]|jgi:glyoxylase-like metal-dependent hydrolase (beta-lactamase superfamily II)|nr:MAG: putative metallo-hydrolase [Spirochaetes bacterium ADurb.Bin269]TAH50562.1 MAG: MBL fold metallo-hydrolase [Treponema sp.]HOC29518.1 MBL fold metallo-hydrolase [Treponemataceae bacterium]HQL32321.1 MBL fold metallo-hydrolase [Treponemataceae bacterium]
MKIYYHFSREGFSNGYLVGNEKTGKAIVIDPGVMNRELLAHIEQNRYQLEAVLVTHNHASHHNGLKTLLKIYSPKVYAADAELNGRKTTMLQGDGSFSAAGFTVRYFSVPGHSPDSLMFQIEQVLFTGDALSAGRLGETNNVYGKRNLLTHLKNKLMTLSDDLILLPGHGPPTTIGAERMYNCELSRDRIETETAAVERLTGLRQMHQCI